MGQSAVFPNCCNSRLEANFRLQLLAGGQIDIDDYNGMVNGSHTLVKDIAVLANGVQVYNNIEADWNTTIKNLVEYGTPFTTSGGGNQFFYPDTNRHPEERAAQANYNHRFAKRKASLGVSNLVNAEIPLNRYSFFEAFEEMLMPNCKLELRITLNSDAGLIWQAGANCRVVFQTLRLLVPRINFNGSGEKMYMERYLKPLEWTYFREMVMRNNSTSRRGGVFRITTGIHQPRHVFIWIVNGANVGAQGQNKYLPNTFSVVNKRQLVNCHLEVGNGNNYPNNEYHPSTEVLRVFRDALTYAHAEDDYGWGGGGGGKCVDRGKL